MVPDPQRRELWLAMFRRTLSDGAFRVEHKFKSSTRTLLLSFQPLKHDDETFGISVFGKDITENLATQERLRQLSQAVEQSPASVIITDMEEKIVYVNPKFCELTGYAAQEVYGLKPRELVGRNMPEESYQQLLNALNSGKEWHGESYSRKKNGELYWESLAIAPITNEMGEITHFASVSEDITPRKGMEEALRRSHEELEIRVEERTAELAETNKQLQNAKEEADKANLAKSEFLSRMSHELRTPLNAILGFGQLLQSGNLAPGQQESVDFILKGGRHLLDLINEVLDIARIEAGRMQLSLEPVSVGDIVSETVDLVRPLSRSTGVELRELVTGTAPEHLFVKADSQRLKQVLLNLMSNALKYNRDGGSVSVACEAVGDHHLRILVRDTGPGIAPEKMERLFIPFERLGAEHSRIEGTGLGLAISKRLIEAMEGRMGVASIVGEGSTFSVELAVVSSPLTSAAPRADSVPVTPAALREHTILYIEDNLSNLHLMEEILRERPGATLISAMQGNEGLKLALNHLPDLILLDLHLPELSGYEVLLSLRAEPTTQRIPVVVVSADATPGQIARMLSAGAYGYLTKPLDIRKFLEVLDKALGDPKER
ncbi:MAG: PAS domain S-box protein [Abitibacteriaceae bacterium]|nr:PAS domain S-box protein [Abditibacteriaceae bacterium]